MSEALNLLSVDAAVKAAAELVWRTETAPDARRAVTGTSTTAIVSMAILIGQFHAIACAAAALDPALRRPAQPLDPDDAVLAGRLAELLQAAGYLPLPEPATQEPTHGEG